MSSDSQLNPFEFSEADTCREYVTPAIQAAGWGDSPFEIAEQRSFTDGRIVLTGRTADRNRPTKQSALVAIYVPVPSLAIQRQFVKLKQALEQAAEVRTKQMVNVESMLPALCNQMLSQQ
jgi:type I restriction enzyme, R subunit